MYEHVQFIRTACSLALSATTRGSRMYCRGLRFGDLSKDSPSLRHVSSLAALGTEHIYTISLTCLAHLFSDFLLPHCLVFFNLDRHTTRDSWRSGGSTEIPSPAGWGPKMVQSDVMKPRRTHLDSNPWTDPYQILERLMRDQYQNPINEKLDEIYKSWCLLSLRPIKDTLGLRLS